MFHWLFFLGDIKQRPDEDTRGGFRHREFSFHFRSGRLIDLTKLEEEQLLAIEGKEDDLFSLQKSNQEITIEQCLAFIYD